MLKARWPANSTKGRWKLEPIEIGHWGQGLKEVMGTLALSLSLFCSVAMMWVCFLCHGLLL